MLLALDPGIVSPGVALFAGGKLVASSRIKITKVDACLGQRWHLAAKQVADFTRGMPEVVEEVVYEKPKVYTWGKSKGDPDDLLGLTAIGAATAVAVGTCSRVYTYEPSEWIGQVSKVCPACNGKAKKKCTTCHGSAWETPRGRFIRSRLSAAELAVAHDQNDELDAIGLALHHLGRLKPTRVYSNGRE